jgi:hypothetical protein
MECTFSGELWLWEARRSDSWTFVTVPPEHSDELRARSGPPGGFGSIRVEVRVGGSVWRTSVFPDKESGCYVLPIKAAVRRAEHLESGDTARVRLTVL